MIRDAMNDVRVRVAVYVTRDTGCGREVLVFDHRDHSEAGTQVPAGGVDQGETLEAAALREVAEETGIRGVTLHTSLGVQQRPHPDTGRPRVTIFYHATTDEPADKWRHTVRTGDGADDGMVFDCFFLPVEKAIGLLADRQDEFLGAALGDR
jgi:ADP-ribose pyrophosphatase YjhB (NUDIX family)